MRIGVGKHSYKPDLSIKYLVFEANGEIHNMHIRYTHRNGIEHDGVIFDGYPAKIIDAYPPLHKLILMCVSIVFWDLKFIIGKFVRKMKDHN